MSEEPFLARWSRRKREVAKDEAPDAPRAVVPDATSSPDPTPVTTADAKKQIAEPDAPFDPASLPPIESIVSATDIRAFLAKGVPAELKRAALRRVWVADPTIRDFVGLAENDWDFTKPESIPGFGALAPDFDVGAMVRDVFGDVPQRAPQDQVVLQGAESRVEPEPPETGVDIAHSEGTQEAGGEQLVEAQTDIDDSGAKGIVQRNNPAPSKTEITLSNHKSRRQHGGALPQEFTDVKRDS
jgi:hypothetical protein